MRYLVLVLLAACSSGGNPGEPAPQPIISPPAIVADVSWVLPTEYTDGSPLPRSEIARSCVYYGRSEGSHDNQRCESGPAEKAAISLPSGGVWWFTVATTAGSESVDSPTISGDL